MNPRIINSTDIAQFGFKTEINLALSNIKFDIADLTVFNGGGASSVVGIGFEIIDPAGVIIHSPDFGAPDIDPDVNTDVTFPLSSGAAKFGVYKIKGVIRDSDGKDYEVVIPPKEVCEPKGYKKGSIPGVFKTEVNCFSPYIKMSETTVTSYMGKEPILKEKDGVLYYPLGILDADLAFTSTPFQTNKVYTGDYVIRSKTIATYDFGDYVTVVLHYDTNQKFNVICLTKICDIACCIEDVYKESITNCGNARGQAAKEKLDSIMIPLVNALAKERCGKDASKEIKEIVDVLKCDCNCSNQLVEPALLGIDGSSFTFLSDCAVTSEVQQVGDAWQVTYKAKHVKVVKGDVGDPAFSIEMTEDDCNIYWTITFNYDALAEAIYNATANSNTLKNLFNSLVTNTGASLDISGLDGKCVIDLSACNYSLEQVFGVNGSTIDSIILDGLTYAAPINLLVSNAAGVQSWLNSLAKGAWVANWVADIVGGTLTLTSTDNTHVVGTVTFTVSGSPIVQAFIADCKKLKAILQAIIDYICTIDANKVKIGALLKTCKIVGNTVVETIHGIDTALSAYLTELGTAFCELVNKVNAIASLNCTTVTGLFPTNANAYLATDTIIGTKGGVCGSGTIKDLATAILSVIQTDASVKALFCGIDCTSGVCPTPTGLTVEMP